MRTGRVVRWRRHDLEDPRTAGGAGGGGEGGSVIDMQSAFTMVWLDRWVGQVATRARRRPHPEEKMTKCCMINRKESRYYK